MVNGLQDAIEKFCAEIKASTPDYISIYSYFVNFINEKAYPEEIKLNDFLKNEFSKKDIVDSCVEYCEKSNATSVTAIEKYLNSMTKLYNYFMKQHGYDNKNLFAILPFSQLKNDVNNKINKHLRPKEVFQAIDDNDFKLICKYFNDKQNPSIAQKEISIICKLIMLYGLKLERIRYMEKKDFDSSQRLLSLNCEDCTIILELPYYLSLEIKDYLEDPACNQTNYMFLNLKDQIIAPVFLSYTFKLLRKKSNNTGTDNRFTSTGLAKYAIINMLLADISVPDIKLITGMEDDVINSCIVEKELNRYVNSKIRSIATYDEIGASFTVLQKLEAQKEIEKEKPQNSLIL